MERVYMSKHTHLGLWRHVNRGACNDADDGPHYYEDGIEKCEHPHILRLVLVPEVLFFTLLLQLMAD
jgi:hypothetical protein